MYERYYKLSGKPFQLTPDPRFFFGSTGHKRAMSYLRYGLTQGEGFIIITGGVGTGKTTLVKALLADLAKENVVAAQLVTTHLESHDTLRMIAASFGLAHEGASKATILKNLETFFQARAREGKRILLIVDEAQNLPHESLEELRMLSNFQVGNNTLMQSFLLGQEEFRETLTAPNMEQVRQRVIAAYHLEPLSANETKQYVEHRLKLAGWKGDPRFTDTAYLAIHRYTEGVPRRVNTFCDRMMLFGYLEELHTIDLPQVKSVIEEFRSENMEKVVPIARATAEVPSGARGAAASASLPKLTEPVLQHKPHTESEYIEMLESRVELLEERLDILERAFRRQLEITRR